MATAALSPLPARRLPLGTRLRDLVTTIRWAPAPRWGTTAREHGRYTAYLTGSVAAWLVLGVALSAALGALVALA